MKFNFRHVLLLAAFSFGTSGGIYAVTGHPERDQVICLGLAASFAFVYSFFAETAIMTTTRDL